MYNGHIVVLESQRVCILQKLHESHQGLTKCRQNAQNAVWWPGLSRDLTELTESCGVCREHRPSQKKQRTILQKRPWRKLGTDLCTCQGEDYLVVIDYYSRWLGILQLHSITASVAIDTFRQIFPTHEIPEVTVSDKRATVPVRRIQELFPGVQFSAPSQQPRISAG